MSPDKIDIIRQLRREILSLQSSAPLANEAAIDVALGPINAAFPGHSFPVGAVHEFFAARPETTACTSGFIAGILSFIMKNRGAAIWLCKEPVIFPPGLKSFGIDPEKIIFLYLKRQQEILWCMEEALKCKGLSAVIAELHDLDFTASRRLQLAASKSNVTSFIIKHPSPATTASIARWRITPLPGVAPDIDMPGIGFPQWTVELLRVRNGKTGTWQVQWTEKGFQFMPATTVIAEDQRKKAG
jgi:protein ImuA